MGAHFVDMNQNADDDEKRHFSARVNEERMKPRIPTHTRFNNGGPTDIISRILAPIGAGQAKALNHSHLESGSAHTTRVVRQSYIFIQQSSTSKATEILISESIAELLSTLHGLDELEPITDLDTNTFILQDCKERKEAYYFLRHAQKASIDMDSFMKMMNEDMAGDGDDVARYAIEFDMARMKAKRSMTKASKAMRHCKKLWDTGLDELERKEVEREIVPMKRRVIKRGHSI
ncbi:hypothetical protein DFH27DRAFT_609699 [Peziza echinospora]|nr:hypothetical protein DFH27DRAFT_609699 [Peziza echinospora]